MESKNQTNNLDDCNFFSKTDKDDSDSLSGASIGSNATRSLELSLPASFWDGSFKAVGSPTAAEIKLLRAQILESRALVKNLMTQQRNVLQTLASSEAILSREEYIKVCTKPNKSFEESISLLFFEQMTSILNKLEFSETTAKQNLDLVDQHKRHAKSLEESLVSEKQRRIGMEQQVDRIQKQVINDQEKARLYDELREKNDDQTKEIQRLRDMLERSKLNLSDSLSLHEEDKAKLNALQHTVESMEIDMRFLEKEKQALEDRAVRAESAKKKSDKDITDLELKVDSLSTDLEVYKVREIQGGEKKVEENEKIRVEIIKEMALHRKSLESIHEREISALNESKLDLIKRSEKSEQELEKNRSQLEILKSEKDKQMMELERSFIDNKSELKIKCVENARMASTIQTLEEELKQCKVKISYLNDQVDAHKAAFNHLENESIFEHKRLQDEITQKEEELNLYHQCIAPGSKLGEINLLGKYNSLSKRCEELQKKVAYLQGKLKNQTQSSNISHKSIHRSLSGGVVLEEGTVRNMPSDSYSGAVCTNEEKTRRLLRNTHYVWNADSVFVSCNPSGTSDQRKHTTHHASRLAQRSKQ